MSTVHDTKTDPTGNGELQEVKTETENRLPAEDKPLDPFDPERLKLSQDFASSLGVKKELLTVPVKKPSKEWFVRVNPDPEMRLQTGVIELKEDRETSPLDNSNHVGDHGALRRRHDPDSLREDRQRALTAVIEKPLGGQLSFQLFKRQLQSADPLGLQVLDV